ncbi:MAG: hypothetical protein QM692_19330 [Thermomicrobiales bacterium]
MYVVPDAALPFGFSNGPGGAHDGRTIMLGELQALLTAVSPDAAYPAYVYAVIEDNALGKRTIATRKGSLRRLRELYALSPDLPVFRILRTLWEVNPEAQPMLAFLSAVARDPLLRVTVPVVQETPTGEPVSWQMLAAAVAAEFPGRFSPGMQAKIGRNAASSWQQSGHLCGKLRKTRAQPVVTIEATVYALALGYLCGARGEALFRTFWVGLLDAPEHLVREQTREAARRGWLDYRSLGGVTEIGFPRLLPEPEQEHEGANT